MLLNKMSQLSYLALLWNNGCGIGSGVVVALVTMVVGWNNGSDDGGSGGEGSSRGMVMNML